MDSDAYFENTNGTEFVKRLKTVKPGLIPFRKIAVVGGARVTWAGIMPMQLKNRMIIQQLPVAGLLD